MDRKIRLYTLIFLFLSSASFAGQQITGNLSVSGNVGIGTTSNASIALPLDVNGTVRMTGFNLSTSPTNNYVLTSDGSGNGTWKVASGGGTNYWLTDGNQGIGTLAPYDVGIGTITPNASLMIVASANTNQLRIDNNNSMLSVLASGTNSGGTSIDLIGSTSGTNWYAANPISLSIPSTIISVSILFGATMGSPIGTMNCALTTGGPPPTSTSAGVGYSVNFTPTPSATNTIVFSGSVIPAGVVSIVCQPNISQSAGNSWTIVVGNGSGTSTYGSYFNQNGVWNLDGAGYNWAYTVNGFSGETTIPLVYTSMGNLGIGTLIPGQVLDVNGTVRTVGFTMPTGASNTYVLTSDANGKGSWSPASGGSGANPGGSATQLQYQVNGTTFGGVSGSSVVSGNIGIGSANPGQILDVTGKVRATNLVKNGGTSSQFLKADGSVDSNSYITGNQTITLSGDTTGSGTTAITTTLKNTGTAGTYRSTTFDAQGRETSGTNPTTFSGYAISDTSANLASALTDETGTGVAVFGTAPTFTTSINLGASNIITDTSTGTDLGTSTSQKIGFYGVTPAVQPTGNICTAMTLLGLISSCTESGGGSASAAGGTNAVQYNSGSSTFAGNESVFSFNGTNVGIGTTNGVNTLDVEGTVSVADFIGGVGIGTTLASGQPVGTSGGLGALTVMDGNVGIGTWKPSANLDVQGILASSFGTNVGIGTTLSANALDVNGGAAIGTLYAGYNSSSGNGLLVQGNLGVGTFLPTDVFQVGVGNGFRVSSAGNISSIGNNNSATITSSTFAGVSSGGSVSLENNSGTTSSGLILDGSINGTSKTFITLKTATGTGTSGSGFISFQDGGTEWARFTGTPGDLGIGTTIPGQMLDVKGTVRFSGTMINNTSATGIGWSEHNATNQACNTTCGTSACVIGLDIGTVGVVNSGFVACTDATADDCICAGP